MKRIGLVIVMAVLAYSSFAFAADGITWLTLKEGTEKAKLEKKPMLIDYYYGAGCPRCEKLEEEEYENPDIAQKIMNDFIPIRVDLTKKLSAEEEKLGKKYDYKKECLLLFLDPEGNIIKDPSGKGLACATMIDPKMFIRYLDTVKKAMTTKENR